MNRTGLFIALALWLVIGLLFGLYPELDLKLAALFSAAVMIPVGFEYGFHRRLHVVDTRPGDWEATSVDLTGFIEEVNGIKSEGQHGTHALFVRGGQRFCEPATAYCPAVLTSAINTSEAQLSSAATSIQVTPPSENVSPTLCPPNSVGMSPIGLELACEVPATTA